MKNRRTNKIQKGISKNGHKTQLDKHPWRSSGCRLNYEFALHNRASHSRVLGIIYKTFFRESPLYALAIGSLSKIDFVRKDGKLKAENLIGNTVWRCWWRSLKNFIYIHINENKTRTKLHKTNNRYEKKCIVKNIRIASSLNAFSWKKILTFMCEIKEESKHVIKTLN